GPVTMALRAALLGIQHGTAPDRHGWMHKVC
ncbi:MAG: branched chain amino acid aminotransferase, partial [Massilia sp.]|nr:branched chain amino acid aminotransferase [Massilia sp.]